MHHINARHWSRSTAPTGRMQSRTPSACSRTRLLPPDPNGYAEVGLGCSLLDAFPDQFAFEIDRIDLLLHTVANFLRDTSAPDREIRIRDVLAEQAPSVWRSRDRDPVIAEAAATFLVAEAAWLIAYAVGIPGCDRGGQAALDAIDWLDAAPRPLRAHLVRAAADRYLQ